MSKPLSKEFLLKRGSCCDNGCTNCPYKENDHIKEILLEADAYGLKWEVETWAKKFIKENKKLTEVQAYQLSYDEWIK
jgi:hypothetical protein